MSRKPPKKPPVVKPPAARNSDDKTLWQQVASSVTPLKTRHKKAARTDSARTDAPVTPATQHGAKTAVKTAKKARTEKPATPQRSTLTRSAAALPAVTPVKKNTAGFDRATENKLRKGQLDIEGRIDLHGMTQDEAWTALARFVSRAHAQHKRTLLVITGKGCVSQGGGVLRRLLPLWVHEGALAGHVLACVPATIKDGGGGAFYLRLRKHP